MYNRYIYICIYKINTYIKYTKYDIQMLLLLNIYLYYFRNLGKMELYIYIYIFRVKLS